MAFWLRLDGRKPRELSVLPVYSPLTENGRHEDRNAEWKRGKELNIIFLLTNPQVLAREPEHSKSAVKLLIHPRFQLIATQVHAVWNQVFNNQVFWYQYAAMTRTYSFSPYRF